MITIEELFAEPQGIDRVYWFFRRSVNWVKDIPYRVKCRIWPYNVVKCSALNRGWHDRDGIMFHAMFQILVDFVELEQPYVDWDKKTKRRFTDLDAMYNFVFDRYSEANFREETEDQSEEYKSKIKEYYERTVLAHLEILTLYSWYKGGHYEFNLPYPKDYEREKLTAYFAAEKEHEEFCAEALVRILKVRDYLWT